LENDPIFGVGANHHFDFAEHSGMKVGNIGGFVAS
jgi:hypothetical protein